MALDVKLTHALGMDRFHPFMTLCDTRSLCYFLPIIDLPVADAANHYTMVSIFKSNSRRQRMAVWSCRLHGFFYESQRIVNQFTSFIIGRIAVLHT